MPTPTTELARRIAASSWEAVNEASGDEAVRALVNWLGCALAGCRDAYVDAAAGPSYGEHESATMLGLGERTSLPSVAELTAGGTDALHYADTHLPTLLHPAATVGGALLPLAEQLSTPGTAFVHAFMLGTEVACRAALALGTPMETPQEAVACNALGAAAACAKLMGLDAERTGHALSIACAALDAADANATARTHRRAGRAAGSGLLAALRAGRGETIDPALACRSGLPDVFLEDWGNVWHAGQLAYHAYPCAFFLHPTVEACIQLKRGHHLTGRQIRAVAVRMHPSRAMLASGADPISSGAAKHSVQHAAAAALLDGEAGLAQFETAKLRNARVKELRTRVELVPDASLPETAAQVTIMQPSGERLERLVRCPLGHPMRPLSDRDLSDKFRALAGETLATSQAERLLGLAWNIRALPDMGGLIRTTIPEDVYEPAELPGSPLIPR